MAAGGTATTTKPTSAVRGASMTPAPRLAATRAWLILLSRRCTWKPAAVSAQPIEAPIKPVPITTATGGRAAPLGTGPCGARDSVTVTDQDSVAVPAARQPDWCLTAGWGATAFR